METDKVITNKNKNCDEIGIEIREKSEFLPPAIGKPELKYTWTQWRGLLVFCLANVGSMCCASLQGPIYPRMAESKGASMTAAGFVFGIFQLTVFVMSLVYGSLLGKIRPRLMAIAAVFVMAFGCIAFGFSGFIDDPLWFIIISFVLRIFQANGNAAFVTSTFTMIASEFQDSVAKAIAYMETAAGLGMICGPAIGGLLFGAGGFILPFVSMGSLLLVIGIISTFYMPSADTVAESKSKDYHKPPNMLSLMKIPSVALAALSVLSAASATGYLLPTLQHHVFHNFSLSEAQTGLVFVIEGAMYALLSPIWGWLCDKFKRPRIISLIGTSLIFAGYLLLGPAPFLPWSPILWGTCLGCVIFGFGLGATFVSGFVQGLTDAKNCGMPDNTETHGLVSGIWVAMLSMGVFVGASAGGYLLDNYGFQNGTYFVLGSQAIIGVCTIIFMILHGVQSKPPRITSNQDSS